MLPQRFLNYSLARGRLAAGLVLLAALAPTAAAQERPRQVIKRLSPIDYEFSEIAVLVGSEGPVYSLAWSPDGTVLASAGYQQVRLWDPAAGVALATINYASEDFIWGVAWSPDGEMLASASSDGAVRLWDATSHDQLAWLGTGWAMCVEWSPDGDLLAVGTADGAQIWDVATRSRIREMSSNNFIVSAAWRGDGSTLALGELAGEVRLFDPDTATQLNLMETSSPSNDANGVAWSPDGSMLASAHQNGRAQLWDGDSGEALQTLPAHRGWARGIAFSPDGRLLVTTGMDASAAVWSTSTWELLVRIPGGTYPHWSVAWSPDGRRFAFGSGIYDSTAAGGRIFIWEVIAAGQTR